MQRRRHFKCADDFPTIREDYERCRISSTFVKPEALKVEHDPRPARHLLPAPPQAGDACGPSASLDSHTKTSMVVKRWPSEHWRRRLIKLGRRRDRKTCEFVRWHCGQAMPVTGTPLIALPWRVHHVLR